MFVGLETIALLSREDNILQLISKFSISKSLKLKHFLLNRVAHVTAILCHSKNKHKVPIKVSINALELTGGNPTGSDHRQ